MLADYVMTLGSFLDVIVHEITDVMRYEFQVVANKNTSIKMNLIEGDMHQEGMIGNLKPEKYDNVIILKGDGGVAELHDSETIATLLEFRHYFRSLGTEVKTQLVSEVADSDNVEVIQHIGVKDFLISNKFVSKIYAQISEDPEVIKANDELFKAEGSEIYLKPVSLFMQKDGEYTFADICAAAIKRNETCFGVRLMSDAEISDKGYGICVNPEKSKKFTLSQFDYLITLAEDES